MGVLSLEEAIRLGLVDEMTLTQLARAGVINPFSRGGGSTVPFWRVPPTIRGGLTGLQTPRFGLGPLRLGFSLSPPAPAISGGQPPVGRAQRAVSQAPPPLATLIGRGDIQEILERVREGTVDPSALPADVRRQIMELMGPPARSALSPMAPKPSAGPTGTTATELGLAKTLIGAASQSSRDPAVRGLLESVLSVFGADGGLTPADVDVATRAEQGATGFSTVPPFLGGERVAPAQTEFFADEGFGPLTFGGARATAPAPLPPGQGLTPSDIDLATRAEQGGVDTDRGAGGGGGGGMGAGTLLPGALAALSIAQTAMGTAPDEYKAAASGIDASALALASSTGGLSLIAAPIAKMILSNFMKSAPPPAVRQTQEVAQTSGETTNFIGQVQQAKDFATLYNTLRSWQTGDVGGQNAIAINIGAQASANGPGWNYLGLYPSNAAQPAPTSEEFFSRLLAHPEEFFASVQAGVDPSRLTAMNQGVIANVLEQAREIQLRERIRPILPSFSKMAGQFVTEDDVIEAVRKAAPAGVTVDSPEFISLLQAAERERATREAADQAPKPAVPFPQDLVNPAAIESPGETSAGPESSGPAASLGGRSGGLTGSTLGNLAITSALGLTGIPGLGFTVGFGATMDAIADALGIGLTPTEAIDIATASVQGTAEASPQYSGRTAGAGQTPNVGPGTGPGTDPTSPSTENAGIAAGQGGSASAGASAGAGTGTGDASGPGPGGEAPHTGGYIAGDLAGPAKEVLAKLREGEYVVPPGQLAEQMRAATPGLTKPGTILTGESTPIRLAHHEESETIQRPDGSWINIYGRKTPQAGQPLPKKYEFERDSYSSVEEAVDAAKRRSEEEGRHEPVPDGSWYLDPKQGVPFRAATNPEPDRAWRLAFNAEQLHDAWSRRGKDGHPLLVPPSLLDRTDWPVIAERARRSQYELVHPAVAMARSAPPEVGVSEAERIFERRFPNLPDTIEGEAEDIRFKKEGEQLPWGPKIPVG